jgi:hypothetical protein
MSELLKAYSHHLNRFTPLAKSDVYFSQYISMAKWEPADKNAKPLVHKAKGKSQTVCKSYDGVSASSQVRKMVESEIVKVLKLLTV